MRYPMTVAIAFLAAFLSGCISHREASVHAGEELPSVAEPTPHIPVTAAMAVYPERATPGERLELVVHVRIAAGHYLHAPGDPNTHFIPVDLSLPLPDGVESLGPWQYPTPESGRGEALLYRDAITIRQAVRLSSKSLPMPLIFTGLLRYQACTDELCWPPATIEMSTSFAVQ